MDKYSELAVRLCQAMEPIPAIVACEAGAALQKLEAERDRLKTDYELLDRLYESLRDHATALDDESRTLFAALMSQKEESDG